MLAKIKSVHGAYLVLALALFLFGCTPAGPRALLKGKRCLEQGDVAGAVTQFRRATTLLSTNANAWNYLGVALQRAGQPDEAALAYQNALKLDHDLVEVYFNLGLLALEQNRPDIARTDFTAYTLRRPNDATGWLKLGLAQLHTGETLPAERSFSTVLALKTSEAEAYNGLGLARLQGGKFRDAAQFFAAALQVRPDFAPALQNLIAVDLQYLHDNKSALAACAAYLSLIPRPANYNDVRELAASLQQAEAPQPVIAPAPVAKAVPPPAEPKPKPAPAAPRPAPASRPEPSETYASRETSRPGHASQRSSATASPTPVATQAVRVQPAPEIAVAPKISPSPRATNAVTAYRAPHFNTVTPVDTPTVESAPANPPAAPQEPLEVTPVEDEQPHHGFWHRLLNGSGPSNAKRFRDDTNQVNEADAEAPAVATPATTVPVATAEDMAGTKPEEKPAPAPAPVLPKFPHYAYLLPAKPAPGDRHAAEGPFAKARAAEQDENWTDAAQWYQTAAEADPAWFEAQYNAGVIAQRLNNYSAALSRYELALALQPNAMDARYNFALALKAAGYPTDAADELKRILAVNPDEVRAHLALAHLCARTLRDVDQARIHYQRVLELQPDNPQASDIRFWLADHAQKPAAATP